jgi:hypothetical protein
VAFREAIASKCCDRGTDYPDARRTAISYEREWRIEDTMNVLASVTPCSDCSQFGCDHVSELVAKYAVEKYGMKINAERAKAKQKGSPMQAKDSRTKHWITIGGHPGPDGKHVGGVHVEVEGGSIVKGPSSMIGNSPENPEGGGQQQSQGEPNAPQAPTDVNGGVQPGGEAEEPFNLQPATDTKKDQWAPADYGKGRQETMFHGLNDAPGQGELFGNIDKGAGVDKPTPGKSKREVEAEWARMLEEQHQARKANKRAAAGTGTPKAKTTMASVEKAVAEGKISEDQMPKVVPGKELTPEQQAEQDAKKKDTANAQRRSSREAKRVVIQERQQNAQQIADEYGITVDELKELANDIPNQSEISDAKDAAIDAFTKSTGMKPDDVDKWLDSGKDFTDIPGIDTLAPQIAQEHPELGWGHVAGEQEEAKEDFVPMLQDLILGGKSGESSWYDHINEVANQLQSIRDQQDYDAAAEEDMFLEADSMLNNEDEQLSPEETNEAVGAFRNEDEEGHAIGEKTPRMLLEDQEPTEEGEKPKAEEKPATEKPAPRKPLEEEMAERKAAAAARQQTHEEAEEAKKQAEKQRGADKGEKKPKNVPKGETMTQEELKAYQDAEAAKKAKGAVKKTTVKELKAQAAEKIAKIPPASKSRTKKSLEDAKAKVEKTDPELAKALQGWLESLSDAASPMWDIRNVSAGIKRHHQRVKSSSPNRKTATRLPGGRMIGT